MNVADATLRLIRVACMLFVGCAVCGALMPQPPTRRVGAPAAVNSAPCTAFMHPGAASAAPPAVGVPSSSREGAPAVDASPPRTPSENPSVASAAPPAAEVPS